MLKVVGRVFHLALAVDIAVVEMFVPTDLKKIVNILQVECDAFKSVGDLCADRVEINAPHLLEIGELRDFCTVPPDFPTEAGGTERR